MVWYLSGMEYAVIGTLCALLNPRAFRYPQIYWKLTTMHTCVSVKTAGTSLGWGGGAKVNANRQ